MREWNFLLLLNEDGYGEWREEKNVDMVLSSKSRSEKASVTALPHEQESQISSTLSSKMRA